MKRNIQLPTSNPSTSLRTGFQHLITNLQSLIPSPQSLISNLYLLIPLLLYAPALTLPFFWDDVANFQHLFGKSIVQVWLDSKGFPYYRPFTFTLWYAMQKIFGATNTVPFHALNVITLLALAWAVSKLAHKLTRDSLVAFIAGTFMGVFPLPRSSCRSSLRSFICSSRSAPFSLVSPFWNLNPRNV